jgi:hypothetical protein
VSWVVPRPGHGEHDGSMSEVTETEQNAPSQELVPSLLSLVIGGVELGLDGLRGRLSSWSEDTPAPAEDAEVDLGFRDLCVGLIFRAEQAMVSTERLITNAARSGGKTVARGAQAVGADRLSKSITQVRLPVVGSLASVVQDLERVGRRQRTRARSLAQTAVRTSTEVSIREITVRAVEGISQSSEVREVIRDQTVGAAQVVAGEVRDVARAADERLERRMHSLLRRKPQPVTKPVLPDGATS